MFLDGGERSGTVSFYPREPLTQMTLSAAEVLPGMDISVEVRAVDSAWKRYEDEDGTVRGNVTTGGNSTASGTGLY